MTPFVAKASVVPGRDVTIWTEGPTRSITLDARHGVDSLDAFARGLRALSTAQFEAAYLGGDIVRALAADAPALAHELASLRASGARGTNLHAAAYALVREHAARRAVATRRQN